MINVTYTTESLKSLSGQIVRHMHKTQKRFYKTINESGLL
jgi:hypothetical protein